MPTPNKSDLTMPLWTLGMVVVFCAVAVYFLLPGEGSLVQANLRDGKPEIALLILRTMPEAHRTRDSMESTLLRIRLERQLYRAGDLSELRAILDQACLHYRKFAYPRELFSEILLLTDLVPAARMSWNWLSPHLVGMPLAAQEGLCSKMTRKALAENEPRLAAEIYEPLWRRSPLSEAGTLEMARFWRLSGHGTAAREAVAEHGRRAGKPLGQDSRTLAWLEIELLREDGLSAKAFEATLALAGTVDLGFDTPVLELLLKTAREGNRGLEALPLLERAARSRGKDVLVLDQVAQLAIETGALEAAARSVESLTQQEPQKARHWLRLGQISEWRQEPRLAFDAYIKAMKLRSFEGLPRLFALSPGLDRDGELAEALAACGEPAVMPAAQRLEQARLRVRVKDSERARWDYERVLAQDPNDPLAHREYGQLLMDLAVYDHAREAFERALALGAEDLQVRAGLAEALFRLGRHAEAYPCYERLAADTDREDVLANYLTLAEEMGDLEKATAFLQRRLDREAHPSARDFLRLAHFQDLTGQPRIALATIEGGLAKFAEDKALRHQAGYRAAKVKDYVRSAQLLSPHPELKTDVEIARLYLVVLLQAENYAEAERFLRSGLPEAVRDHIAIRELEANLRESLHQYERAAALFEGLRRLEAGRGEYGLREARVLALMGKREEARRILREHGGSQEPETLAWMVQVAVALRDYPMASTYQRRYVASHPREMGKARGLLGDILTSLGDGDGARREYRNALDDYLAETRYRNEP
jgi:tetratricopeptide (TPR) repeat protein